MSCLPWSGRTFVVFARFGGHQVFPERQQTGTADRLLQRDVFDQKTFPAACGPPRGTSPLAETKPDGGKEAEVPSIRPSEPKRDEDHHITATKKDRTIPQQGRDAGESSVNASGA